MDISVSPICIICMFFGLCEDTRSTGIVPCPRPPDTRPGGRMSCYSTVHCRSAIRRVVVTPPDTCSRCFVELRNATTNTRLFGFRDEAECQDTDSDAAEPKDCGKVKVKWTQDQVRMCRGTRTGLLIMFSTNQQRI